jgi:hypothetical protein
MPLGGVQVSCFVKQFLGAWILVRGWQVLAFFPALFGDDALEILVGRRSPIRVLVHLMWFEAK